MDLRVHPTVRPLTPEYLAEAAAQQMQQQQQQQQQSANNQNNGSTNNNSTNQNDTTNPSATTNNTDIKPKQVILAPFGLAGTLTGQSYRVLDAAMQKAYKDWCSFYPLCNRDNNNLPQMVEVITGKYSFRP